MKWMFIVDIGFYALLGLLTFPLLVLMLAHVSGMTFSDAYKRLKSFQAEWAEIAPKDLFDRVLKTSGVTAVLVVLGIGPYLANRIGDAVIPHSSAVFKYFGSDVVRWSVESSEEWDNIKWDFRNVTAINADKSKWEEAKGEMGRHDVRFFRTLAVMSMCVGISAVCGLLRGGARSKAFIGLVSALLVLVASHWVWVDREQQFIKNLIARYVSEHMKARDNAMPVRPASYKGWWPELSNARLASVGLLKPLKVMGEEYSTNQSVAAASADASSELKPGRPR
jgi:hypothetical protein